MSGATDALMRRAGLVVVLAFAVGAVAGCTTPGDIADEVSEQAEKERDRQNAERSHREGMGSLEDRR
ncbi:hypothetical protein [Aquisalimonas asiatica]|uniref:Secreted protein n=1 Tax=Aquisalimonas asiatica TaxID=406100 RepID=A0A1H8VBF7_9GAMM|nr:hypothetical protein [Aquisalimonas asiatica]SEP12759.1 hypothetical protein SAMN04488052_11135 [Aquisalimonas asiatica]